MHTLLLIALGVLGVAPFFAAAADAYPNRPVRLIVPYPAGGPNDVLARMVGGKLGEVWNQRS
jgi:tripartite-type tricarboxylate transporter receptor subunit TctC